MIPPPPRKRSRAKRFAGVALLAAGLFLLVSGSVIAYLNIFTTDREGYSMSDPYSVRTSTCAFFVALHSENDSGYQTDTKFVVTPTEPGKDLFVGWAWFNDTTDYLKEFSFEAPKHWTWDWGAYWSMMKFSETVIYNNITPAPAPANRTLWLDHARTGDTRTPAVIRYDCVWQPRDVMKSMVIMNADGSAGVNADLRFGARIEILGWMPYPLVLLGIVLLAAGAMLLRRRGPG